MMNTTGAAEVAKPMGRKKGERPTVMTRVYAEWAESVKQAASERRMTVAEFAEQFLSACVDKAHREYIAAESRKLSKGKETR